ncbi:MAG: hypothetical protein ACR2PH_11490, partial [Desulfobulbia bacterium]
LESYTDLLVGHNYSVLNLSYLTKNILNSLVISKNPKSEYRSAGGGRNNVQISEIQMTKTS